MKNVKLPKIIFLILVLLFLPLTACTVEEKAYDKVIDMIDGLPTEVSLDDEQLLINIEDAFNKLSLIDQEKVSNIETLKAHLETLQILKNKPTDIKIVYENIVRDEINITTKDTISLQAAVYPLNKSYSVTWESSDESVATVNNGDITVINPGLTVIKAIVDGYTISSQVTIVIKEEIKYLAVDLFIEGKAATDNITFYMETVYDFYTLSNPVGANINIEYDQQFLDISDNTIRPIKAGTTTITVKALDVIHQYFVNIATPTIKIALNDKTERVIIDYNETCEYTYVTNVTTNVIWTYDDEMISMDDGIITPKAVGQVVITATIEGTTISDSITLLIYPIINIVGVDSIEVNDSFLFTVDITPNIETSVVWSVNNTNVSINENGMLTALEPGNVIVKAQLTEYDVEAIFNLLIIAKQVPTAIEVLGSDFYYSGNSFPLEVKVTPDDLEIEVEVKSSDEAIATIQNGQLITHVSGIVTLTASYLGVEGKKIINVVDKNVNNSVQLMSGINRDMTCPYYWLSRNNGVRETIMTTEEILKMNSTSAVTPDTKLVDITKIADTISSTTVRTMINSYTFNSSYAINGVAAPSNYGSSLITKNNLSVLSGNIVVKYGLINKFSSLRSFPTDDVATRSGSVFDRFQETGLNVGEMVAIYHVSQDGNWYFVQASNYYGWVKKNGITEVSKDVAIDFLMSDDFLIVTGERITVNNTVLRMGTRLPLVKDDTTYEALIPTEAGITSCFISKDLDVNVGYLTYNMENTFIQAFKLLKNPYDWGDSTDAGRDCSSTMNAVYHCFGFLMPRNTSNQQKLPFNRANCNSYTARKAALDAIAPGSLVFSSGHVMMYIGCISGQYYILHNSPSVGSYVNISILNINSMIAYVEIKL